MDDVTNDVQSVTDCGLSGLTFTRPSLCKPQFAADCDLSTIVQRFLRTGQLPDNSRRAYCADVTGMPDDYQVLQDAAVAVRQRFDSLPLEERNRYNGDPDAWLASLDKPADKPVESAAPADKPVESAAPADQPAGKP